MFGKDSTHLQLQSPRWRATQIILMASHRWDRGSGVSDAQLHPVSEHGYSMRSDTVSSRSEVPYPASETVEALHLHGR